MQAALSHSVLDRVITAVTRVTYVEQIRVTPETELIADLKLGGFGRLKLAMYLEEVFETELSDEAVGEFATIADVVTYMDRHCFADVDVPG